VRNVTVGSLDDERIEVTATGPNQRVARALVLLLSGCLVALGESVLRGSLWSHMLDAAVAVGFFGAAAVWVGRPLRGDRTAAALAAGGSWCLAGLDVRWSAIWWPAMAVAVLPGLPGLSGKRMASVVHRRPAWAALIGVAVLAVAAASRGLGAGEVAEFLALVGATIGILVAAVRPREGDTGASIAESSAYGAAGVLLGLGIALPAALVMLRLELLPAWGANVGSSLLAAAGACLLVIAWADPGADAQLRDHVIEIASEPGAGITGLLLPAASARAPQAYSAAWAMLEANAAMVSQLELQVAQSRALQRRLVTAADTEREQLAARLGTTVHPLLDELRETLLTIGASVNESAARGEVGTAVVQVERTLDDLQRIAQGLHPQLLSDGGLRAALSDLAGTVPIQVRTEVPLGRLEASVETALWYLCAEAVTNSVKHSGATRATIHIERLADEVVASISDDGSCAADPAIEGARGKGLTGVRDRIVALGGDLDVLVPSGAGLTLVARLP
jgi:signal transduction histidine kinase